MTKNEIPNSKLLLLLLLLFPGLRDFFLVGIHVQPSDAVAEIDALTSVYDHMRDKWNVEVSGENI